MSLSFTSLHDRKQSFMPCVSGLGPPPRESIKPQRVSVPLLNIPKPPPKSTSSRIPTIRSAVSSLLSCPKPSAEKVPQLPVPVMPKVLMPRTPLITPPPSPAVPPLPEMNTTGHRALKSGASKMTSVSALTPRIPIPLVSAARLPSAGSGRGHELGSIPGPASSAPLSPVVPVSAAGQLVGRGKNAGVWMLLAECSESISHNHTAHIKKCPDSIMGKRQRPQAFLIYSYVISTAIGTWHSVLQSQHISPFLQLRI